MGGADMTFKRVSLAALKLAYQQNGRNASATARQFNMHETSVRDRLRKEGVQLRTQKEYASRPKHPTIPELKRLVAAHGGNLARAANAIGRSRDYIGKRFREVGIKAPNGPGRPWSD